MRAVEAGQRVAVKNVLFATDLSPCSNTALPYALSLSRRYGAKLHVVHVKPSEADMIFMSPENWPAVAEEEERRTQGYLDELEQELQGLPHAVLTPRGRVSGALAQIIEACQIDFLVLGTHGRSGVSKLFMGSIAEEIFRRAVCPVLSVGPGVLSKPNDEIQFHHILFATDFSKESLAALPYAISMAEEDQARLLILHVVEQPAAGILDLETVTASLQQRLKKLVPSKAELWCQVECFVDFGQQFAGPAARILEVAKGREADLIVLGVHRVRSKLPLVTHLSGTTTRILNKAACPVLTVCG